MDEAWLLSKASKDVKPWPKPDRSGQEARIILLMFQKSKLKEI